MNKHISQIFMKNRGLQSGLRFILNQFMIDLIFFVNKNFAEQKG